jgi:hypothetical protein
MIVSCSNRATCKEYLHVQGEVVPYATVKDSLTVRKTEKSWLVDWAVVKDYLITQLTREVLTHPGKVSHEVAEKLALGHYTKFDAQRREAERVAADKEDMKVLENMGKSLAKQKKKSEDK